MIDDEKQPALASDAAQQSSEKAQDKKVENDPVLIEEVDVVLSESMLTMRC